MHLGFTGTRKGMTPAQHAAFVRYLESLAIGYTHFHHGDCVGADAQAHTAARQSGMITVAHPGPSRKLRAFMQADIVLSPDTFRDRNQKIVDSCDLLLAAPAIDLKGTIMTIKMAQASMTPVVIFDPDGNVKECGFSLIPVPRRKVAR